jgi:histone H3/H4
LAKERGFSLYDIEQFFRDAGAERVNEKAVVTLEKDLEDMVKELVSEAQIYANYAGRKTLVTRSDIAFARGSRKNGIIKRKAVLKHRSSKKIARKMPIFVEQISKP